MATGLDANTTSRMILLPALVRIAGRSIGPTRGGVTITTAEVYVQPEADGVNQEIVGFGYKRSTTCTVEFSALELSPANMALIHDNVAPIGTPPSLTWQPYPNMTMFTAAEFLQSPGLQIYAPFTSVSEPGFMVFTLTSGRVKGMIDTSGAMGEGTIKFTVTSAVAAGTPDALPWSWAKVAALPAETGGP